MKEEQDKNKEAIEQMKKDIEKQVQEYEEELKKINGVE